MEKICPECKQKAEFPNSMSKARNIRCPQCGETILFKDWLDKVEDSEESVRFNLNKLRFDLIPPEADKALAEVLTMGAMKYSDRNWEKGTFRLVTDIIGSMKRHLNAWEMGEDVDEESGYNHTKHILWNAMALAVYVERGVGVDDRTFKKEG